MILKEATMLELCMIFPTRERPAQAAERLHAWVSMAIGAARAQTIGAAGRLTRVVVGVDDDDPTRHELLRLLAPLFELAPERGIAIDIAGGMSFNKIHATNRCVPRRQFGEGYDRGRMTGDFDVLIVNSDDMEPQHDAWDAELAARFAESIPDLDGALWCHDGHQDRLMTWPVIGRAFYDRLGHVYHRAYETEWADNELHEIAARRGRLVSMHDVTIVRHRHPAWGDAPSDALYQKNNTCEASRRDCATFMERKARNFDWPEAPMLSVLIPSVPERAGMLRRLLAVLEDDMRWMDGVARRRVIELVVEVAPHVDRGGDPIGARRQRMLERARGLYVCFIDDDDFVAARYLRHALTACSIEGADCVALDVRAFLDGGWFDYEHSRRHGGGWAEAPVGRFLEDRRGERTLRGVRYPNHLNVIRREIALAQGFATEGDAARHGEDKLFSDGMRAIDAIKTEGDAWGMVYYYVPG